MMKAQKALFLVLVVGAVGFGFFFYSLPPSKTSLTTTIIPTTPAIKEIVFNGTRLKEGDIFNFSPKDSCVSDIQVKLLKVNDNSIMLQKLQEQGMNLEYYPVEETETLEIENNTCIQALPICLDVGYQYCFTMQKNQGTLEYSLTTPSESLFPFVQ